MFKKFLIFTIVSAFFIACKADSSPRTQTLVPELKNILPSPEHPLICQEVIKLIENYNFKKTIINDSIANIIYNNFIKALDPAHVYFIQSDIDAFEKEKGKLADDLHKGELTLPFYMFNVYLKSYTNNYNFSKTLLNKKANFNSNETYVYNREKLPWIKNTKEMQGLWHKKVTYELLSLEIGNNKKENKQKSNALLNKRYSNLINQASQLTNQDVFQLFMKAVTDAIDPHTSYFNPDRARDFNESMSLSMEGIGAQLLQGDDGIKVMKILPGGPAFKQNKLKIGDVIIGVAQGMNTEFEDIIGWRIDKAVSIIKGKKNTVVRLKIIPEGKSMVSKPEIITLTRDKIILEEGAAKKVLKTVKGADGKSYKVGVIELPSFYFAVKDMQAGVKDFKSTSVDVAKIIDTLKSKDRVDAIIMDLRGNGGGSLLEVVKLVGLFTGKGPVVQVKSGNDKVESNDADTPTPIWTGPLGVMTDRLSASASEIFAGAIQDYGRGIIMGSNTYGKGTVQSTIDLNTVFNPNVVEKIISVIKQNYKVDSKPSNAKISLGQLNLTIAKFYRITGSSTQNKGVTPDILFPSIFDEKEIGESSEPAALPWDTVPATLFNKSSLDTYLTQIKALHVERMKASVDLKILNQIINDTEVKKNETTMPLNLDKLKFLQDSLEKKSLFYTNELRAARGLKAMKKGDKEDKKDTYDFILNECLHVISDFIRLQATKPEAKPIAISGHAA